MCGIVGIASGHTNGFSYDERKMFEDMLFVDTLRGWDSTGVFGVDKHRNVGIVKDALHGADFIQTENFKKWCGKVSQNGLFAVGHNRAATRGSVSDKNAHPFWVNDEIVLVQNGTYKGSHKHHKDVEVDSEAIAHVLAEEKDVEKALQKVNAAYALVWFDTRNGTLNLIRNEERPLHVAFQADGAGVFFASEASTIAFAAWRNNIRLKERPSLLEPHQLVTLSIKGKHFEYEEKEIDGKYRWPAVQHAPFHGHSRYGQRLLVEHSAAPASPLPVLEDALDDVGSPLNLTAVNQELKTLFQPKPDDIRNRFKEMVPYKVPEALIPWEEGLEVANTFREEFGKQPNHVVELVDCIPANVNPNCTSWWVYGYLVDANSDKDNSANYVLCYWLVMDKTKEEIINYVCDDFYKVTLSTMVTQKVRIKDQDWAVLSQLCSNQIALKAITV